MNTNLDQEDTSASDNAPKLVWTAPRLECIAAGSAEDGFGPNADGGQPS